TASTSTLDSTLSLHDALPIYNRFGNILRFPQGAFSLYRLRLSESEFGSFFLQESSHISYASCKITLFFIVNQRFCPRLVLIKLLVQFLLHQALLMLMHVQYQLLM